MNARQFMWCHCYWASLPSNMGLLLFQTSISMAKPGYCVPVTHVGRLRRAKGWGPNSIRGWSYSHHLERKYNTEANRELTLLLPLTPAILWTSSRLFLLFFNQFYLPGWNLPPPSTFPSKIIFKIPFLLNFLSIYIPLEKAGHPWVTFNSIPPIDFNGCKIRTSLNNVFERSESESGLSPCHPHCQQTSIMASNR